MKKQLLVMFSLSCVAYNLGMDDNFAQFFMNKFAKRLLDKKETSALAIIKEIEEGNCELPEFTLQDIATRAEVLVNGNPKLLTFACLQQGKLTLLERLLNHVERPSALNDIYGNSLSMHIFSTMCFELFFKLATKDKGCLFAGDRQRYLPLLSACELGSLDLVRAILAKADEHGMLAALLCNKNKFSLNTLEYLNFITKNPTFSPPANGYTIDKSDGINFAVVHLSREEMRKRREKTRELIQEAHCQVLGIH